MRIFQLTLVFLGLAILLGLLSSTAPQEGWFAAQNLLIDRAYRFFDAMLHVLGVAALIKYLYSKSD
tara:strand:- start:119 stop:316 length:198 start_codon:yes stop_codon:yes gene_type:complete